MSGDVRNNDGAGQPSQGARAFSSYEYLKLVEETGQMGFWTWSFVTGAQHWSLGMRRMFGIENRAAEPTVEDFLNLIHPDDRAEQTNELNDIIHHGVMRDRQYRIIRPDGALRWVACRGEVQLSREGRSERAVGILCDVSALHEALRQTRRAERRLKALAEVSGPMTWTATADGGVIDAPSWRSRTGQKRSDVEGFGWVNAIHPDDRERTLAAWRDAVANGTLYDNIFRARVGESEYAWVNARGVPVRDEHAAIVEWIGVVVDLPNGASREIANQDTIITGAQTRAARGLLHWSEVDLCQRANVSRSTVRRVEEVDGQAQVRSESLQAIRRALEEAGVEFTFPLRGKPGVQPK